MDVAQIMVRTKCMLALNKLVNVLINGKYFSIKVVEDSFGPMWSPTLYTLVHMCHCRNQIRRNLLVNGLAKKTF